MPRVTRKHQDLRGYTRTGSDPFWLVMKGVDQAAHDMCVTAIYEAPPTFDMVAMSTLLILASQFIQMGWSS